METYERKINRPTEFDKTSSCDAISVVMTFRTQNLMDLYINEISGQISDGMWENSKGTKWLWGDNAIYQLGDTTTVKYRNYYDRRKKNYYLSKMLIDVVGERARQEAGFETMKEMKVAWREIADAIHNATLYTTEEHKLYVADPLSRNDEALAISKMKSIEVLKTQKYIKFCKKYSWSDAESPIVLTDEGVEDKDISVDLSREYKWKISVTLPSQAPWNKSYYLLSTSADKVDDTIKWIRSWKSIMETPSKELGLE